MGERTSTFIIRNARLVLDDTVVESGWLRVENGVIREMGEENSFPQSVTGGSIDIIDAHGQWVLPGLIDIHIHGGDGYEVMDGTVKAMEAISRFHATHGTTGWLPTTLTAPIDDLERAVEAASETARRPVYGAQVLGVHLEGPFISPERCGAQNPAFVIPPSIDVLERLAGVAEGLVKKVTIAPEREGAIEAIRWMRSHDIIPSIGHTDGTLAETLAGVSAGATHATHLFNAMRGLHHREGGTVGAVLLSEDVVCELIADGHHVDVDVMKLVYRVKGRDKMVLITDAMAAAGKPDGHYKLGELDVIVEGGVAVLEEGHNLAGSTLTMDAAVRNMVRRVGVTMWDAAHMASTVPARELGLLNAKGSIALGKDADLVMMDEALHVVATWVAGQQVFVR
ncbi:N-acetylglucosamine-6-phosphate deacetylase [Alicyclobacillus dauci]|uniref:N-acetylglucosamine-6-phosphate deacetylase n=1 Tax=Alicyclobacillus dauci TaxID=1475485 RepID=A0ABY6YZL2_9BACL|nr:N-acetylglucosamine-6-phosphate deacetylase [Alicyclobacillus dauci]WAH36064.1 N-acetylglucosamine-6-phosphate deacetylase [Alicyclobacillus dauci]